MSSNLPENFEALNAELVHHGWHDLSPWWRDVIGRVYSTDVRNVVIRGGRRGGKSTSVCRVAAYEILFGDHYVPPGDIGYFAIISAERAQAKERIVTISKILQTIGIEHKALSEEIRIPDMNVAVRCMTASLSSVVSFTCVGALCDEEARWRDRETGANPATEILASLRPTMATQKNGRIWHVSSPWSTLDVHHKMVMEGDTRAQIVFSAPTWEMNPTISEADTYILEPDEPTRLREYGAVPMLGDSTKFFDAATVRAARELDLQGDEGVFAGADFAFRKDNSALVIVETAGDGFKVVYDIDRTPPITVSATVTEFAEIAEELGADGICCDLHYIEAVREYVDRVGLGLVEFPNDVDSMNRAYIRTRVLLADGKLDLSGASEKLISQLLATQSRPNTEGLTIEHPRNKMGHGDLVPALVAAIWAADQDVGVFRGSRSRRFYRDVLGADGRPVWREFAPTD